MLSFKQSVMIYLSMLLFVGVAGAAADRSDTKPGKFLGAMHTEYPEWFKESFLDFNEDVAEASAAGKRLMLLFHQENCPYCNALVERNLSQKEIETMVRKNFDVVALNMWGDREVATIGGKKYTEKDFASALKVQFTPTILFFNEQGKVMLRLNGYLPPPDFKLALDFVANKMETKTSYQDYVAKHQKKHDSGKLFGQDFFQSQPYDLSRKKGKNKPFAIFFEQKDCPGCETLHKQVLIDPGVRKAMTDFDSVQLDMWSDTPVIMPDGTSLSARQLAKKLDIKYAPSIVIFNEKGEEVIRSEAFFKVFHTQGMLTYASSGSYAQEPNFQRYLSGLAHDIQASGKNVDIWRMHGESKNK